MNSSLLLLLVYHINFVKITNCYEPGALPRVTVLSSQALDLLQWRANLDIDVVKFPAGNLSFYDALKVVETISRTIQEGNGTKAIIGSGNKFIDRLTASTLGLLVIPFISVLSQDEYQGQLYLNLSPSRLTDHINIAFNIADELGCQHVAVFTSSFHRSEILQQILKKTKGSYISSSIAELHLNDTPIGIARMMTKIFKITVNYNSVLVVMDCSDQDASLLIEATNTINIEPMKFHWLFLREEEHSTNKVKYLPINVFGLRSKFDKMYWVQDALLLLNGSLYQSNHQNKFSNTGPVSSKVTDQSKLYRKMLDQAFLGKTGWIHFDEEGNRMAGSYDIIITFQVNSSRSGEVEWVTVGSASNHKVSFQRSLLTGNVSDRKKLLRIVVIEEEPMLIVSKEDVGTFSECVLSYPCTKYKQFDDNSKRSEPIKCCCIGFLIDLLQWLEKDLTNSVELHLARDGKYGAYNADSKEWDGMIGELLSNRADMALSALTITRMRERYVDFSFPYFHGETKLLISVTPVSVNLGIGFLTPFDAVLWIVFLATVSGILATVWLLERISPNGNRIISAKRETRFSLSTCMSYIWSNVVKLELEGKRPRSISARLTTAVFSFSTLIIITTYTAKLAASLVQLDGESPVTGINDPKFQDPPAGFTFTTLHSSSILSFFTNSDDPAYRKIGRNMIPYTVSNYNEGLEKLKRGEIKAFIYDSPFIDLGASKMPGCSFKVVGKPIFNAPYGLAFPRNSKWRDPVSNLLLKYQRKDYFWKLKGKWFRGGCFFTSRTSKNAEEMRPVNFGGLFLVLGGTIVVCFFILLGEYLWSRHEQKAGKYTPSQNRTKQ
ncbi:glutamate receptor ionotropic, NMDA 1-like [Stylophora pistillata]|uniref:glutamate receptor ionotropic, NMDA 1-like n=1 Tax=Stylophora pistillata TaxID=50429 RepID=UPI000C042E7C|nr:glutamate receptor ionotropic, NMDA 1-like [Stylophora pistillata]